jgi:hypothetical protein
LALSWGEVNGRFEVRLYGQTPGSDALLSHELQSLTAQTLLGVAGGAPGAAPVLAHRPAAGGPRGHLSAGFQFLTPELSRGFRGSIAQLRIYPGVLDAATVALIRKGDVAPGDTGTDQGLPIDLSFENE